VPVSVFSLRYHNQKLGLVFDPSMVIFRDMQITRTVSLMVVGVVLAALPAAAVNRVVKPTDYAAIEKRNPFGLVDPPKPQVIVTPVEPVQKEPPPNVELTGMFHDSVRNKTYALFLVQVKGEQKKRSYMLSEGENQDGLKVERIDRKSSNVKINLKGEPSTITYNEPKAAAVANSRLPTLPNGKRAIRSPGHSLPPGVQSGKRQLSAGGGARTFSGTGRSVNAVGGGMNVSGAAGTVQPNTGSASLRAMPTRQLRTPQPMNREEQEIIIEAQRARNQLLQQQNPGGAPPMPPLPPTRLTTPADYQRIVVPPSVPNGQ